MTGPHAAAMLVAGLLLAGCASSVGPDEEILILEVAPQMVDCTGEAHQRCMQVRQPGSGEWTRFYDRIEGFAFEEGVRYRIEVARSRVLDPPADASSYRYRLLRVLERDPVGRSGRSPGATIRGS